LQAEEEAVIARIVRRGRDDAAADMAAQIRGLRNTLAQAAHGAAGPDRIAALTRDLDAAERALGRLSRDYRDQLKVREANLRDLQGALKDDAALVEFSRYRPVDFGAGDLGRDRWAAVVVQGHDRVATFDLGPVAETEGWISALTAESAGAGAAARALHDRLIAPLGLDPAAMTLIAPDNLLHLVPFHRLVQPDGRMLAQSRSLRIVQSGRDLLRAPSDRPASGLLAIGGLDFDGAPTQIAMAPTAAPDPFASEIKRSRTAAAEVLRGGFSALPGSGREVAEIAALYRAARPRERVETWRAAEAGEARLTSNDPPPRVLHLATHGFYRAPDGRADRPMLLSGIALSGANLALREDGQDGVLYAIEAQDLNLEGTELVVLSACETAQGTIGHGEGVYGLVRALRTAGARNVLVALRKVDDDGAATFMRDFYESWLGQAQGRSSPAKALEDIRRRYINADPGFDWTPFVMVGAE
jgi:CHAT domain-containing protein